MTDTSGKIVRNRGQRWLLWSIGAIAFGVICTISTQWFVNAKRPANDGVADLVQVKLGVVVEKNQWINNFDVYVAPVTSVRTPSNYLLLIIMPKSSVDRATLSAALGAREPSEDGRYNFELKGVAENGSVKPVLIDPRSLSGNSPLVIILDYIDVRISVNKGGIYVLQSLHIQGSGMRP